VVLVLFIGLSPFTSGGYPELDRSSGGAFPTARNTSSGPMQMDHGGGQPTGRPLRFDLPGRIDGRPSTNSFGLGNWTGLAALVIVVGLLALSTDGSLRELKARRWKNLQRLNYALFVLVVLHAFFYGALLRTTSPFTLLLFFTVLAVFVGQAAGIWLWRQRNSRHTARQRTERNSRHDEGLAPLSFRCSSNV